MFYSGRLIFREGPRAATGFQKTATGEKREKSKITALFAFPPFLRDI